MASLEDYFNARDQVAPGRVAEISNRPPPAYSIPKPTYDGPPTYTQAMDDSVEIRLQNWSIFSGYTLADINCVNCIPLPLVSDEIRFGETYVSFEATTNLSMDLKC